MLDEQDEAVCTRRILGALEDQRKLAIDTGCSEWLPIRTLWNQVGLEDHMKSIGPVTFRKVLEALEWCGEIEISYGEPIVVRIAPHKTNNEEDWQDANRTR